VLAWALLSTALWLGQQAADALAQAPLFALLDWQPVLWQSQPWRLWTAALVHWSGAHLLLNIFGCAALIAWGHAAALGWHQTLAWLLAWPLTQLLLATAPTLLRYGGLSGVLHAGVAIGAWALIWHGRGQRRMVGALVLAGLALKLLLEEPLLAHWLGLGLTVPTLPLAGAPGFAVASYAHFTGTVAGLACAVALDLALSRMRRKQRGPALG
jgi:membrane associated rhomboid family serine protease